MAASGSGGRIWWRTVGVGAALLVASVAPGCTTYHLDCAKADLPLGEDVRTARAAVAVGAEAVGMGAVPTEVDRASFQDDGPMQSGGNSFELLRFSRSKLVDFAQTEPAVRALEGEGFEVTGGTDEGTRATFLERGQQVAKVEVTLRLRDTRGMATLIVSVSTGCRGPR